MAILDTLITLAGSYVDAEPDCSEECAVASFQLIVSATQQSSMALQAGEYLASRFQYLFGDQCFLEDCGTLKAQTSVEDLTMALESSVISDTMSSGSINEHMDANHCYPPKLAAILLPLFSKERLMNTVLPFVHRWAVSESDSTRLHVMHLLGLIAKQLPGTDQLSVIVR